MNFFQRLFGSADKQLKDWVKNDAHLLDVRSIGEFSENGIEGSLNIPIEMLYQRLNELNKNQKYVVFCRSGNRSRHALDLLKKQGFTFLMDGKTVNNIQQILKND